MKAMKKTSDLIVRSATEFYSQLKKDPHGRYRSWEYCYQIFSKARNNSEVDIDYLSLHLGFYLASWGMYRGSSFLLRKDYKVHMPVVREILNPKYDPLLGIKCQEYKDTYNQELLWILIENIKNHYKDVRDSVHGGNPEREVSITLITKILMGTLGCVPAYDRYFRDGVKNSKITSGRFNLKSLLQLVEFYEENNEKFESVRKRMRVGRYAYPQMKMLDMGFWQIGFELDPDSKLEIVR